MSLEYNSAMEENHEGAAGTQPSAERRGLDPRRALFRDTVDRVLKLAEALPDEPTHEDIEPLRELLASMQDKLEGDPELEHRMRNILIVTNLSPGFASPSEAVEWIKATVRTPARRWTPPA